MPANLPPQYFDAEKRFRLAKTSEEKIRILYEMLAIMPKHKGTEKLQAEVKTKISKLRKQAGKKHGAKRVYGYHIEKEGAGRLILLGAPNSGKSQLLATLTNAEPKIAAYPFTTREPVVGMMEFENIKIQLIDTPAISENFMEFRVLDVIRSSDIVLLVVDLGDDNLLDHIETIKQRLEQSRIMLVGQKTQVIQETEEEEYIEYLQKSTIVVANKNDLEGPAGRLQILMDSYKKEFLIISVSAQNPSGLEQLKKQIYYKLDIIRVYTKAPGEKAELTEPVILKTGSTVIDAARYIHKDFINMKYAKLWDSDKYNGQRVERNHILKDGDVLEFHI
jgi:small GTP-binding protein